MAFVQRIAFASPHGYFAGYLQNILDQSAMQGAVTFKNGTVTLMLDDSDPAALETFADRVSTTLPYSIFIQSVDSRHEAATITPVPYKAAAAAISLCPRCIQALFDPASANFLDQTMNCTHYGADTVPSATLPADIDAGVRAIQEGRETTVGDRTYRRAYREGETLFVADPAKLHELLLLSPQEANALLSIEKPRLTAAIRDIGLQTETGRAVIPAKLFDDAQSAVWARALKEAGIPFVFMAHAEDLDVAVHQDQTLLLKTPRLAAPMQPLDDDPVTNRFLNMVDEFDLMKVSSIGAYLGENGAFRFILRSAKVSKPIIAFPPFEAKGVLETIAAASEAKTRLIANFTAQHPAVISRIKALEKTEGATLFELIAAILEIPGGYGAVQDASLGFAGSGGVKVDVNYAQGRFDYHALLASLMSFKLAGVATPLLSYSLFESLSDLVTDTLTQLKARFKTDEFILFGSLLGNAAFFSRVRKNFGHAHPHISSRFALDG